jgi:AmmeMemoRadiSam system protein A
MSNASNYAPHQQQLLLDVAHKSIAHGLKHGRELPVDPGEFPPELREHRATFVTLHLDGDLRGCIGTLSAHQPLVRDVAHHAHAAAFADPRFAPLTPGEAARVSLHISVLTPARPITVTSEADLLAQLRPGIDGLILEDGYRRGTFLPSVWESLPDPRDFLRHLKRKAGLSEDHWSPTLTVSRYEAESIGE